MAEKKRKKKPTKTAKKAKAATKKRERINNADLGVIDNIWGVVFVAIGMFLFISIQFNAAGQFGLAMGNFFKGLLGLIAYILPWYLIVVGILLFMNKIVHISTWSIAIGSLFVLMLCLMNSGRFIDSDKIAFEFVNFYNQSIKLNSGGLLGMPLAMILVEFFGKAGLYIISLVVIIITLLLTINTPVAQGVENFRQKRAKKREQKLIWKAEKEKEYLEKEEEKLKLKIEREKINNENEKKQMNLFESKPVDISYMEELKDIETYEEPEVKNEENNKIDEGKAKKIFSLLTDTTLFNRNKNTNNNSYGLDGNGRSERPISGYGLDSESEKIIELINSRHESSSIENNEKSFVTFDRDDNNKSVNIGYGLDNHKVNYDNNDYENHMWNPVENSSVSDDKEVFEEFEGFKNYEYIDERKEYNREVDDKTSNSLFPKDKKDDIDTLKNNQVRNSDIAFYSSEHLSNQPNISNLSSNDVLSDEIKNQLSPKAKEFIQNENRPSNKNLDNSIKTSEKVLSNKEARALNLSKNDFVEKKVVPQYRKPSLSLLNPPVIGNKSNMSMQLHEKAMVLEKTLHNFKVKAKVVDVSQGPAVTRFEIQPDAGVSVKKIVNLSNDIALNLRAKSIRMEAPIPGKAAVGIEIENETIDMVTIREIIDSKAFKNAKSKISFTVGKDISGKPIVTDLKSMPHLLIAGSTGSGKSVCINSIIISMLYHANPDEVKLVLIDPKVVELGNYNGIPHLLVPVVTDPNKAAATLNWAVTEMTKRYKSFAKYGVRDIAGYNEYVENSKEELEKMPQVVIIIDELADLMMASPTQVEESICRLAQMARAAGMHLIVATQRPSVDIITGVIKANIPSRIAFAVSSQFDSRTILDMGGAEKLVGKGDMLFNPLGSGKPIRVQGCFISDDEVHNVIEFIKNQDQEVEYSEDVIDSIEKGNIVGKIEDNADELLPDAIKHVVETGQASTSMIQRRFRVGYNRGARIMDMMEERGIISSQDGSRPRQVLISKEELDELEKEEE